MFKTHRKVSLGTQIKNDIMRMIISGRLKPGDILKEVEISEQMSVSRIPVREALLMLEQEGFIESGPYKNNVVIDLDVNEIVNVYVPIRRIIECYALNVFVPRATDADYSALEYEVQRMELALRNEDVEQFVDADIRFHEYILEAIQLQSLITVWSSISNRMRIYFYASSEVVHEQLLNEVEKHAKLVEILRTRDLEAVQAAFEAHINEVVLPR